MGEQLTALGTRLAESEQEKDDAAARAEAATTGRAEADERARGAVTRADTEATRAQNAESELTKVRELLEQARVAGEKIREEAGVLRGNTAALTVERDAARDQVEREKAHGDQRGGRSAHHARAATRPASCRACRAADGNTRAAKLTPGHPERACNRKTCQG